MNIPLPVLIPLLIALAADVNNTNPFTPSIADLLDQYDGTESVVLDFFVGDDGTIDPDNFPFGQTVTECNHKWELNSMCNNPHFICAHCGERQKAHKV